MGSWDIQQKNSIGEEPNEEVEYWNDREFCKINIVTYWDAREDPRRIEGLLIEDKGAIGLDFGAGRSMEETIRWAPRIKGPRNEVDYNFYISLGIWRIL